MKIEEIKNLKFYSSDLDKDVSIIGFLKELLVTLFEEMENFSGKRPFGNSDWDSDIIICLIKNKVIKGKIDEDGYIEDYDYKQYLKTINKIIKSLV